MFYRCQKYAIKSFNNENSQPHVVELLVYLRIQICDRCGRKSIGQTVKIQRNAKQFV